VLESSRRQQQKQPLSDKYAALLEALSNMETLEPLLKMTGKVRRASGNGHWWER
jgi:hypothetical protein